MIKKRIPNTIVVATTGLVTAAILLFFRLGIIDAATMTMAATVSGTAFLAGIVTLVYEYDFGYSKLLKRTLKKLVDEARDGVKVLRQDQKLDITLVKAEDGQHIRVNSMHHYWLKNCTPGNETDYSMSLHTDVGRQGEENSGGYEKVIIGEIELEGEILENHIDFKENAKAKKFTYTIAMKQNRKIPVTMYSYGVFLLNDRLTWTVEDLCRDFSVDVINKTGLNLDMYIKINHHNAEKIQERDSGILERSKGGNSLKLDFGGGILPYEGFELSWRLSP